MTDFSGSAGNGQSVAVVDLSTRSVITNVVVGEAPYGMAMVTVSRNP